MVDTDTRVVPVRDRGASGVAWLALILSLIALTLGWLAYNRAGKDLEDSVSDGVNQVQQDAGEAVQQGADTIERGVDTGPDGVDDGAQ